jgi:hypothetical protein
MHEHPPECKHDNLGYCQKCNGVRCKDCNKKWYSYILSPYYYYPNHLPYYHYYGGTPDYGYYQPIITSTGHAGHIPEGGGTHQ